MVTAVEDIFLFCEKDEERRRRYDWESQHETTYVLVVVVGLTLFFVGGRREHRLVGGYDSLGVSGLR
jgi:hypothetical protein